MATFPELEPSTRAYNFGVFPLTEISSVTAGVTRFRHNTIPQNYALTLGFVAISDAKVNLIRDHYKVQGGSHQAFALPTITWKGHSATNNVAPAITLWRYSEPPEEEHLEIGHTTVSITLISDGEDLTALFNITVLVAFVGGVAGASNGLSKQVTTSFFGGGAIGGLQVIISFETGASTSGSSLSGLDIEITAILDVGAATGA